MAEVASPSHGIKCIQTQLKCANHILALIIENVHKFYNNMTLLIQSRLISSFLSPDIITLQTAHSEVRIIICLKSWEWVSYLMKFVFVLVLFFLSCLATQNLVFLY